MKKTAIMQPYLFPYLGYFQLIQAVDCFVVYDDVNYIKQGWINRNSILVNGKKHMFTLNLVGASSFKKINEIQIGNNKEKIYKMIAIAYSRAPYYDETMAVLGKIVNDPSTNLAMFLYHSLQTICAYLEIGTRFRLSSEIEKNNELRGQDKVIHICSLLKTEEYINAIGGVDLYRSEDFLAENIRLRFLKSQEISYLQNRKEHFEGQLSIIDLMMFNSKEDIKKMLVKYELVEN